MHDQQVEKQPYACSSGSACLANTQRLEFTQKDTCKCPDLGTSQCKKHQGHGRARAQGSQAEPVWDGRKKNPCQGMQKCKAGMCALESREPHWTAEQSCTTGPTPTCFGYKWPDGRAVQTLHMCPESSTPGNRNRKDWGSIVQCMCPGTKQGGPTDSTYSGDRAVNSLRVCILPVMYSPGPLVKGQQGPRLNSR